MQVYRGMDIGTAKPKASERLLLSHHLIDIRDPNEQFSSGEFTKLAEACIADIASRGLLPVVSGGTAFYLKNLLFGHPEAPPSDPAIREGLKAELSARGAEALMEELKAADPVQAEKIHIRDEYRLTRALEVVRSSGRALSSFRLPERPRNDYDFLCLAIDRPREELYARIEARVDAMMAAGLADELEALKKKGYGQDDPGLQAIGYREFMAAVPGTSAADISAEIKKDTRRYAKRQLTFFRSLPGVEWFDAYAIEAIAARVASWIAASGSTTE
jgi:tRNA dimethylallyltransferase